MVALKRGIGLQFLLHASLGLVSKIIKRVCLFSSAGHPSVLNRVFFFFFFSIMILVMNILILMIIIVVH